MCIKSNFLSWGSYATIGGLCNIDWALGVGGVNIAVVRVGLWVLRGVVCGVGSIGGSVVVCKGLERSSHGLRGLVT